MIRDYVTNYDEPAVKSKTAARSSWIMSLVERSRGGEVDLGERELSEERTPLWPRGESVLCACLSQGQPLSVQYMPATFTRTRANTAGRLTVVYRVSCELSRDWTLSMVKSVEKLPPDGGYVAFEDTVIGSIVVYRACRGS